MRRGSTARAIMPMVWNPMGMSGSLRQGGFSSMILLVLSCWFDVGHKAIAPACLARVPERFGHKLLFSVKTIWQSLIPLTGYRLRFLGSESG
jgi:hypothetical protein